MYGYSAREAVGRTLDLIVPPEQRPLMAAVFEQLRQGVKVEPFETTRMRKDGGRGRHLADLLADPRRRRPDRRRLRHRPRHLGAQAGRRGSAAKRGAAAAAGGVGPPRSHLRGRPGEHPGGQRRLPGHARLHAGGPAVRPRAVAGDDSAGAPAPGRPGDRGGREPRGLHPRREGLHPQGRYPGAGPHRLRPAGRTAAGVRLFHPRPHRPEAAGGGAAPAGRAARGGRPPQGRVPRHARPRAAQSPRPDPQRLHILQSAIGPAGAGRPGRAHDRPPGAPPHPPGGRPAGRRPYLAREDPAAPRAARPRRDGPRHRRGPALRAGGGGAGADPGPAGRAGLGRGRSHPGGAGGRQRAQQRRQVHRPRRQRRRLAGGAGTPARRSSRCGDSGIGVEPELLARVFEPFSQADWGPDRSRGGLGLGLALVQGAGRMHGGGVEARSPGPGHGTESRAPTARLRRKRGDHDRIPPGPEAARPRAAW